MAEFFEMFGPQAAIAATAARRMIDLGLTPEDVLRLYDEWMAERMQGMIPASDADQARAVEARATGNVRRRPGQADAEFLLGPCPRCGRQVWGIKKCPHISPPWRAFFACDSDDCAYHGRSRLTVEALRRKWPEGAEVD